MRPSSRPDLRLARDYAAGAGRLCLLAPSARHHALAGGGRHGGRWPSDLRNYAWCLMNIGAPVLLPGRLPEGDPLARAGRPIFDQRDLLTELAYVHTDLGTSYRVLDEPRAPGSLSAAFDCVAQLGDHHGLATAYHESGQRPFSLQQYDARLQEHRKALRVALRRNDRNLIASVYNNMGLALEAMEQFGDAVRPTNMRCTFSAQSDDVTGVSACYNNLGSVCYAQGDLTHAQHWYGRTWQLLRSAGRGTVSGCNPPTIWAMSRSNRAISWGRSTLFSAEP